MKRRDNWIAAALFAGLFWLVLTVGAMDAKDAARERAVYCKMVAERYWPDYKGEFKEICDE